MSPARLKIMIVIALVVALAFSGMAGFLLWHGTILPMREKIQLSATKIEIISEQHIVVPPQQPTDETITLIRIPEGSEIAVLGLKKSSDLIVRSPEQDDFVQAHAGAKYPAYAAYDSYGSFAWHIVLIYAGAGFGIILVWNLFHHIKWMKKAAYK